MRTAVIRAGLVVAIGGFLALASAAPASADTVDEGEPGRLWIDTTPISLQSTLSPGDRAYWGMSTMLATPTDGDLDVVVSGTGALAEADPGLNVEFRECSVPWGFTDGEPSCAAVEQTWLALQPFAGLDSDEPLELGILPADGARHFLAVVELDSATSDSLMGHGAEYRIVFTAAGDTEIVESPPGTPLVVTGVAALPPLLLATGLAATGAVAVLVGARRKEARR